MDKIWLRSLDTNIIDTSGSGQIPSGCNLKAIRDTELRYFK